MIKIFTDGSSRATEDTGGFGLVIFDDDTLVHAHQKQFNRVTNNQMELMAIIYACQYADRYFANEPIAIYSDSQYCVKAINEWMDGWANNGWKNSKKEPVKNIDLMKTLYKYFHKDFYHCQVLWLKGHNEDCGNELADALATHNEKKFKEIIIKNKVKVKNVDFS